jgi:hypothetical protein
MQSVHRPSKGGFGVRLCHLDRYIDRTGNSRAADGVNGEVIAAINFPPAAPAPTASR